MKETVDYWFTIEPYVFVKITSKNVLLYNTLDGVTIESEKNEIIEFLREILKVENCGVILLKNEQYKQKEIYSFIHRLRSNYMGDIINVSLSKGKPVQLLPYINFPDKLEIYKKHNFSMSKNVLNSLYEISIYVDSTTIVTNLIVFLQSIPKVIIINIVGDLGVVPNCNKLLSYLDQYKSSKNISCCYKNVIALQHNFKNDFSFTISVSFPIDIQKWENVNQILLNKNLPVEYVFDVSSNDECFLAEQIVEKYQINEYRLNPIYTGNNILFFEENVFLTKEDILSIHMTIKDIFSRQTINIYDFGKINIMPNGDAYANLNHTVLGNIYTDNIYDIVHKEIENGKSWFRIRNQSPCNDCIYQWLCPPPSNYEIAIGRSNLCHVEHS